MGVVMSMTFTQYLEESAKAIIAFADHTEMCPRYIVREIEDKIREIIQEDKDDSSI